MLSQINRFAFNSSRSFLKNNLFKTIPQRTFGTVAATAPATKDAMFCFQCEQTRDNVGCKTVGVCGKTPEVAALQDLLIHSIKGISSYSKKAAELGARDVSTDQFVLTALFSTLTNVNFDASRFVSYLNEAEQRLESSRRLYEQAAKKAGVKAELSRNPFTDFKLSDRSNVNKLIEQARPIGVDARKEINGADYTGLQELITYGLKGTCAYAHHAMVMGEEDPAVYKVIHDCLEFLTHSDKKVEELLKVALTVGDVNLKVMQMLDQGHTKRFGHPEPTKVRTTPVAGKAIAVSGHDLRDLEELLRQTEGKNINVYTHGEILPAHGYPGLRKYKHLVGNYGGPWQLQQFEFANFPGSILMTSNCIIEPRKSYKNRLFTRDMVGWPGVPHISGTTGRDKVDFTPVIETALAEEGFEETVEPAKYTTTGFGRNAILASAGAIVDAVKKGELKHFFLIGGCDGAEGERNYFKEVAMNTPKDSVILTLACGKYRFNMQEHGTVAGLPRMLDIGQCNDAHSAIQVASALAQAFGTDVNSLPLSFVISWFEQKAVAVLLSLLSLNIKNIYLGPNLPAFATPNMLKILVDAYGLKKIGNPKSDLQAMLNRK